MSDQIQPFPLTEQGDENHPVQTLQYLLRARGQTVAVDGIFGPVTDDAVRGFQGGHENGRQPMPANFASPRCDLDVQKSEALDGGLDEDR